MKRNRIIYLIASIIVIILGLMSRKINSLPNFIKTYSGDVLWALMVFLLISLIFNKRSTLFNAVCAIVFSYGIEISQLYHSPWIDSIRATMLGGLVLGFGFLYSDLLCYIFGIALGIVLDKLLSANK
ncbi:DUF2809 domain-containing protein [Clostridium cylindrosporum]|uniref:DUF2809 domain-containing protein n=1 Tax=Clostridium cylindrosporum DSM 605 TaxID=1121307 RepID=A0A0J8D7T7_CLOCY|nr:DUF2809 domain-containing protein [Clostridium cylindrosporum]KMT21947.1 hypothetical protein CLCY_3c02180 [Clostridium cylindrosporum DSM 605]